MPFTNILKCIIVGQRLDFDIGDYPEQARRLYRANGEKGDLVDMAVIFYADNAAKARHYQQASKLGTQILGEKPRRASDRESAGQAAEFATQAGQAFRPT